MGPIDGFHFSIPTTNRNCSKAKVHIQNPPLLVAVSEYYSPTKGKAKLLSMKIKLSKLANKTRLLKVGSISGFAL